MRLPMGLMNLSAKRLDINHNQLIKGKKMTGFSKKPRGQLTSNPLTEVSVMEIDGREEVMVNNYGVASLLVNTVRLDKRNIKAKNMILHAALVSYPALPVITLIEQVQRGDLAAERLLESHVANGIELLAEAAFEKINGEL